MVIYHELGKADSLERFPLHCSVKPEDVLRDSPALRRLMHLPRGGYWGTGSSTTMLDDKAVYPVSLPSALRNSEGYPSGQFLCNMGCLLSQAAKCLHLVLLESLIFKIRRQ